MTTKQKISLATKHGYFDRFNYHLNNGCATHKEAYYKLEDELESLNFDPRYTSFESFKKNKKQYFTFKDRDLELATKHGYLNRYFELIFSFDYEPLLAYIEVELSLKRIGFDPRYKNHESLLMVINRDEALRVKNENCNQLELF